MTSTRVAPDHAASALDLADAARRRDLVRMKTVATGLLVLAAIVFAFARWREETEPAWGYVRATAEAAMVGALADWFAVTALFKHPLGIPIPHTAIIRKRKDQIGSSLGSFVRDNFLTKEVVSERLQGAGLARQIGHWLTDPANVRTIGEQSAAVVRGATEVLNDDMVQSGIEQALTTRIHAIPVSPIVGRAVDAGLDGDHHQVLIESTLEGLGKFLRENEHTFRTRLSEESPWWVPEPIDDRVFDKIFDGAARFIADVGHDRSHPLRRDLDIRIRDLSERLKSDPALRARGEELKEELLSHPEVRAWSGQLWLRMKTGLIDASNDPDSELRRRLEEGLVELGHRIDHDPELQAKLDEWIIEAVVYVADQFRDEAADVIATTVQNWDAAETSDRLELQVGRDLQFIRINGTIVGGLAGLVIFSVSEALL